jgi:hypothetical protein
MSSFLNTYLKVFAVFGGIALVVAGLFWILYQLIGEAGFIVGFVIMVVALLSFGVTAAIENG